MNLSEFLYYHIHLIILVDKISFPGYHKLTFADVAFYNFFTMYKWGSKVTCNLILLVSSVKGYDIPFNGNNAHLWGYFKWLHEYLYNSLTSMLSMFIIKQISGKVYSKDWKATCGVIIAIYEWQKQIYNVLILSLKER